MPDFLFNPVQHMDGWLKRSVIRISLTKSVKKKNYDTKALKLCVIIICFKTKQSGVITPANNQTDISNK